MIGQMDWIYFVAAPFLISAAGVSLMLKFAQRLGLVDVPGDRSSHAVPRSRGGGVGMVSGILAGLAAAIWMGYLPLGAAGTVCLIAGVMMIAVCGLIDDRFCLDQRIRFFIQITAAALALVPAGYLSTVEIPLAGALQLGVFAVPVTVFWIAGITNIYNFMDGIDGLAAGQAVIAGASLFFAGYLTGNRALAALSIIIAASAFGFLIFNFPPARIFMGDVGSTTLGFLFAVTAVMASGDKGAPVPFPAFVMVLGVFIFDSTVTLVRRVLSGAKWYAAHREHFYQRAVQLGYTHRQVTLAAYVLMALLGAGGVLYITASGAQRAGFSGFALGLMLLPAIFVKVLESYKVKKKTV